MGARVGRGSRLTRLVLAGLLFALALGTLAATPTLALAQEGEKKEPVQQDLFLHLVDSAGIFFGPLLLIMSICLVTLIVLLAMDLRMSVAVPPFFVDEFTDLVNKRQFKQAYELCRSDNSFLGRVMTAGMARLQYGIEDAREAAVNQVESVKAGKDQIINYMGTIGTLGPMIGLVGTVFGMILAFRRIAASTTAPKADELAGDISHALVVTLLGIAISVPAIFCHVFFKNRLTRISMEANNLADDLLTQLYHNSKKAAATPAAAAVPAAPTVAPAPPARPDQRGIRPGE
ncbi:MAG: MotA/TolQ/ExbB proton channel family protein [Gemmataceae bacterium]|nr:MotA/TolQ/ExbB proton channel family protein [Gemmataceae bacterium]